MTQVTYPQNISKKSILFKIGSLFIRMGRGLTKRTTIVEIISALLIILFIYTGINKIMDFAKFKYEMGRSPFIQDMANFIAYTLPPGELLIGLALILKRTRLLGLYLSFALMAFFTGYIWMMLNYDFDLPCSCGGIISKLSWNDHLIVNSAITFMTGIGIIIQSRINSDKTNSIVTRS